MYIAENLRSLREERGISQMKMAQATGLSHATLARWELGQSEPTASSLVLLADFFNISIDDLLDYSPSELLQQNQPFIKTEIQQLYDELTPQQQEALLNYARGMAVSNSLAGETQSKKKRA